MRKNFLSCFALILFALCPIILLSSCGGEGEGDLSEPVEDLSDNEIIELYRQAGYAYGWFEIYNIEFAQGSEKEIEGLVYYKVSHDDINSLASLREYLGQFFAGAVIDGLINSSSEKPKFIDVEGELYVNPQVRPANRYAGEESFRIVRSQGGGLINLLVDVQMLDENMEPERVQEYTFVLKFDDGRWIFENFSLVQ